MRHFPCYASLLLALLLTGCQSSNYASQHLQKPQLNSAPFAKPQQEVASVDEIFTLDANDLTDLKAEMRSGATSQDKTRALLRFIFKSDQLPLHYVNSATLVAHETLQRREANCLSLTILAYALAKEVGFNAEFHEVQIPEYWITDGHQSRLNGHVNLLVVPPVLSFENGAVNYSLSRITVDFDTENRGKAWPSRVVTKEDIVAMFYNNKAADSLVAADYAQAFAYLKAAVEIAPNSAQTWANLSVLYRQVGLYKDAEESYLFSLRLNPNNSNTMANLAVLYRLVGQTAKAIELEEVVARKRKLNPFYHLMLGDEALNAQQTDIAKIHFNQALRLNPSLSAAMFGMAKSYIIEGDIDKAAQYLQDAKHFSQSHDEKLRYESKLKILQQVAVLY